jgi:hypothetical protein
MFLLDAVSVSIFSKDATHFLQTEKKKKQTHSVYEIEEEKKGKLN